MDELKRKPMRDFTEVTDIADTARIIGLQDNENVRIPLQSLIAKTLNRVDEDILTRQDINVENGVTGFEPIGEVKEGDKRAVSGEEVYKSIGMGVLLKNEIFNLNDKKQENKTIYPNPIDILNSSFEDTNIVVEDIPVKVGDDIRFEFTLPYDILNIGKTPIAILAKKSKQDKGEVVLNGTNEKKSSNTLFRYSVGVGINYLTICYFSKGIGKNEIAIQRNNNELNVLEYEKYNTFINETVNENPVENGSYELSNSKNIFNFIQERQVPNFFNSNSSVLGFKNLLSYNHISELYILTNNTAKIQTPKHYSKGYRSVFVPVEEFTDYFLSDYTLGLGKAIGVYDKDCNKLDTINLNSTYNGSVFTFSGLFKDARDIHIKTPAMAKFIMINISSAYDTFSFEKSNLQIELGVEKTTYEKPNFINNIDIHNSNIEPKKRIKTTWVGTSIPAGKYNGIASYPMLVCDYLNSELHNESQPSSQVRISFLDGKEFDQTRKNIAFANTNYEKTINGSTPGSQSHTYETKLLSTNRINSDLFIFDFGINDASRGVEGFDVIPKKENGTYNIVGLTDDTVYYSETHSEVLPDWQNRKTFIGAMNFVLSQLFKAKPLARVILISHHENKMNREYTNIAGDGSEVNVSYNSDVIIKAQERIAEYWSLPLIRLDSKLGWSQFKVNDVDTIYSKYAPDELHPYLDKTGNSTKLIADVIKRDIENLY